MTARAVQERLNAAGFGPLTVDGNIGPATLAALDRALSGVAKTSKPTLQAAPASGIKFLTIHCAATPRGRDVKAATVADIGRERFGQPSYHHVVELDGNTVRLLQDNQKGAHVGGHNTGNIGICYVGRVESNMTPADTRTEAQKAALRKIVSDYKATYPGIIVRGHSDWPGVAKACPSFDVATAL
jgi:N-acetylmuramoyl-L-alanine amidase